MSTLLDVTSEVIELSLMISVKEDHALLQSKVKNIKSLLNKFTISANHMISLWENQPEDLLSALSCLLSSNLNKLENVEEYDKKKSKEYKNLIDLKLKISNSFYHLNSLRNLMKNEDIEDV